MLKKLGVSLQLHKEHFVHDAPDDEWIPVVAAKGWAIISGDKGIEFDGINRAAVQTHKAKVFTLADTTMRGVEWAATLVAARKKIYAIAEQNIGPFYCTIEPVGDGHVGKPRFLPGGYTLQVEPVPETLFPVSDKGTDEVKESPKIEDSPPQTPPLFH